MAFVMIAGPQILSAIFLATSEKWRQNSIAFLLGAFVSINAVVIAAYLIGGGVTGDDPGDTVYIVILVLLVLAAIQTYRKRKESEPPKWMGRLQAATPRFSFTLGSLLLGLFPTDILTSVAVGTTLSQGDDPWWHSSVFVLVTLLLLALPLLVILVMGDRGRALLPKVRDWMTDNSWIVSEIVIGLFIVLTAGNLG
jgi:threonine/homoserine/homoserine lactone efflux protein